MALLSRDNFGFEVDTKKILKNLSLDKKLFSETQGFVLEVGYRDLPDVLATLKNNKVEHMEIGFTTENPTLIFKKGKRKILSEIDLDRARNIYENALRKFMS